MAKLLCGADSSGGKNNARRPRLAVRGLMFGISVSPYWASRWLVRTALRKLRHALPSSITEVLIHARYPHKPRLGQVNFGHFNRVIPISRNFGFERGTPVDRYYIERFLAHHSGDIRGRVLEVGDDTYCRRFGAANIRQQDILHITPDNPSATIVGDLCDPSVLPSDTFDSMVLTQTLHLIFDLKTAVIQIHRALKPGGMLLLTVPGITPIDRGTWHHSWYWALTPNSSFRLFADVFGNENVSVENYGNVFAATAFLQGVALEELERAKLDATDPCYPVIVAVRARKIMKPPNRTPLMR